MNAREQDAYVKQERYLAWCIGATPVEPLPAGYYVVTEGQAIYNGELWDVVYDGALELTHPHFGNRFTLRPLTDEAPVVDETTTTTAEQP